MGITYLSGNSFTIRSIGRLFTSADVEFWIADEKTPQTMASTGRRALIERGLAHSGFRGAQDNFTGTTQRGRALPRCARMLAGRRRID